MLRQMLLHNPYAEDHGPLTGRAGLSGEERAMRWAQEGVTRVNDVLAEGGARWMTVTEFEAAKPALRADAWVYEAAVAAMPRVWASTLRGEQRNRAEQLETWWTDREGRYWRRWTEPKTADNESAQWLQQYCKEKDTPKMYATGDKAEGADPPVHCTECRVQPVRTNNKADPEWETSTTRDMRRAAQEHAAFELVHERAERTHEPLKDVGMQPPGLLERQPVPMADLTNKHMRQMLVTPTPVMPRASCSALAPAPFPSLATAAHTQKPQILWCN